MIFMLVGTKLRFINNSYYNTFTNMSLTDRVRSVVEFFCLSLNPCASVLT